MDDRKYEILKKRLDALDYKFPFNIESMPLIEAILADLSTLHQKLKRSRRSQDSSSLALAQRIEYLNKEKEKLEQELKYDPHKNDHEKDALLRVISDLKSENKTLNQKLAAWQVPKMSEPDMRSYEYTEKLFKDCNNLRVSLEESKNQSLKLSIEYENLLEKYRLIEQQNINLRKEVETSTHTIKNITGENRSTTEEFFSLKQTISSYESKQVLMQNEVNRLKIELQRSQTQCNYLEKSLSEHNKESIKLRGEVESHSSTKIRANSTIESLQKQVDILTSENNKLHSLREEGKTNIKDLEVKIKDLETEKFEYHERLKQMMKENHFFSESLREKNDLIKNKEGHSKLVEREMEAYKVYVKKHEDSLIENKKLTEENEELLIELRKAREELTEAKGKIRYKEEDSRQFKTYLEQANKDIEQLKRNLQEESFKSESVNVMKRNTDFLEEQISIMKGQFEESLSRERQLHREVEQFRISLQKSEEKLAYAIKQADFNTSQKLVAEGENSKLQRNLNESTQRENSKNLEIAKLETKNQGLYSENEDLKIELRRFQDENSTISQELKDLESMYQGEKAYVSRLNDQVAQLKDFISTLESSRNESLAKIEHFQVDLLDKENLIKKLREEMSQVKKQLVMSETMYNDGVLSQESLLKQTENLKLELNRKSDELSTLKNSLRNYMNEVEDLKNRIKGQKETEDLMKREIRELEIEKSRFEEQSRSLGHQNEENQKNVFKSQSKISDLSSNLSSLMRDNKKYEDRVRTLEIEVQNLYKKLEEFSKDNKNKQEIISNLSRENDELSSKYKSSLENLDKLSRSYDYLNLDFKKMSTKVQSAENISESLKKQEEIFIRNRTDIEEELRRALRTAEVSEIKRLEAEKSLEDLKRESHQQKVIVRDFDFSNEDLHRRLCLTENEKSFYETRLKTAENEIVSLRDQLEEEKRRTEELEIKNIRGSDYQDENRSRTYQENGDLVAQLYKQIEAYKCDSLKLEMDYMRLMDEYTKSTVLLRQAEEKINVLERR